MVYNGKLNTLREREMNNRQIRLITEDLYTLIFRRLDAEIDIPGPEAGAIAARCQVVAEAMLKDETTATLGDFHAVLKRASEGSLDVHV